MDEELEHTRVLLERAREGDEEAYEALFARHRGELERRARASLSPALQRLLDPSDLVQECELAALEAFEPFEYRGPGSFRSWLYRILENRVAMERRFLGRAKRDIAREVSLAPPSAEPGAARASALADSASSPSDRAAADERRARLQGRLASLPEDHRRVVELVRLEERTIAEAAAQLGRSENAVKKLLARALLRLRDGLREEGLGETR
jgi:RNA polymerase sigma-70 factor (ECF subfamily)